MQECWRVKTSKKEDAKEGKRKGFLKLDENCKVNKINKINFSPSNWAIYCMLSFTSSLLNSLPSKYESNG